MAASSSHLDGMLLQKWAESSKTYSMDCYKLKELVRVLYRVGLASGIDLLNVNLTTRLVVNNEDIRREKCLTENYSKSSSL